MSWPRFAGRLQVGADAGEYAADFGRAVTRRPAASLRAASVADVVTAVRHARARGLPVVARGQGHTTRGQSQCEGGLVLDLRELRTIEDPRGETIRVGAGALWSEVVARTCAVGLTPPVLTDFLELSVGGTLSVGGVGGQSFCRGLQVDQVAALEVVTGAGETIRCGPGDALFEACLGGLGQFGVIVAATLKLEPAPARVRVRHVEFSDLEAFLAGQIALGRTEAFGYLVGNFLPPVTGGMWRYSLECVEYLDGGGERGAEAIAQIDGCAIEAPRELAYYDYVTRLQAMAEAWRRSGAWEHAHPWIDLFVPERAAAAIVADALAGLDAGGIGAGYVMTYPLLAAHHRRPSPGLPEGEALFLFDILPAVPRESHDRRGLHEERAARLFAAASAAGATVYPIGYPLGTPAMDAAAWQRQLGRHAEALRATKARHDPDRICNPELGMFAGA